MILRFQRCRGLVLWRWGRKQWVLWVCPDGENIPEHTHPGQRVRIFYLGGCMWWRKGAAGRLLGWDWVLDLGRSFFIEPDEVHGLWVIKGPGVFLAAEELLDPALRRGLSAADNFVEV